MNSPSPLIPQGSNLEQQNQARAGLKVKIFCAIGVNVAVLLGLLLTPGCKREQPPVVEPVPAEAAPVYDQSNPPPVPPDAGQPGLAPDGANAPQAVVEPPAVPLPPAVPPGTASEYQIQAGDSFYTIGKKFNVSPKAIQAANPTIDPKKLQIGKSLVIPPPAAAVPTAGAGPVVDVATGETLYTVKSGDTLGKLATQFHTTVAAIQSANGLADTRIKVGQKLKIPAKSGTP